MEGEKWRWVKGYRGLYKVSNHGRVKSVPRVIEYANGTIAHYAGCMLKPCVGKKTGYAGVRLSKNNRQRGYCVHVLVITAFVGPKPYPKAVVNHKNSNKLDNRSDNLEWVTHVENAHHAILAGVSAAFKRGERHSRAKLTDGGVRRIKRLVANGWRHQDIADLHGVHKSAISHVIRNKVWSHVKN